mmetsp:Transcript_48353/g.127680  ORF Transcript_48353/g.127680 Transcript_48353/m.127680 type:complete len:248 (+) Transcript_48353:393-1136(+)
MGKQVPRRLRRARRRRRLQRQRGRGNARRRRLGSSSASATKPRRPVVALRLPKAPLARSRSSSRPGAQSSRSTERRRPAAPGSSRRRSGGPRRTHRLPSRGSRRTTRGTWTSSSSNALLQHWSRRKPSQSPNRRTTKRLPWTPSVLSGRQRRRSTRNASGTSTWRLSAARQSCGQRWRRWSSTCARLIRTSSCSGARRSSAARRGSSCGELPLTRRTCCPPCPASLKSPSPGSGSLTTTRSPRCRHQ